MPFISKGAAFVMDAALHGYDCEDCRIRMDYIDPTGLVDDASWKCSKCGKIITAKELEQEEDAK